VRSGDKIKKSNVATGMGRADYFFFPKREGKMTVCCRVQNHIHLYLTPKGIYFFLKYNHPAKKNDFFEKKGSSRDVQNNYERKNENPRIINR
jgi:hypothetical protein